MSKNLNRLETFTTELNCGHIFRQKVRKSVEYNATQSNFQWFEKHNIYDELHDDLKYEICKSMHLGIVLKLNFFFGKVKEFINE